MKVIFLDIDGVLNTHEPLADSMCGAIHRDKMELLNVVLRDTGAHVVLSSAWRYFIHRGEMNLAGLEWLLRSHGMVAGRLIGVTDKDTMRENMAYSGKPEEWPTMPVKNERGQQIANWLATSVGMIGQSVDAYVVVDDLDLGISAAGHPFIHVDDAVGLRPEDAARMMKLLHDT